MMPNFFSYVRAAKYKEKWNYIRYLPQNKNWLKSKETAKQHNENKQKKSEFLLPGKTQIHCATTFIALECCRGQATKQL